MTGSRPGGRAGRIILLNGTSSSGKTTIARLLQDTLPDPWLEMGIDRLAYALPRHLLGQPMWPLLFPYVRPEGDVDGPFVIRTTPLGQQFVAAMHEAVAALADGGWNVIVDHVLLEPEWLAGCSRSWARSSVLYVAVRCPLPVVRERELKRRDRTLGQAEAQYELVHRWPTYDIEVDTSVLTPEEAVARIVVALDGAKIE